MAKREKVGSQVSSYISRPQDTKCFYSIPLSIHLFMTLCCPTIFFQRMEFRPRFKHVHLITKPYAKNLVISSHLEASYLKKLSISRCNCYTFLVFISICMLGYESAKKPSPGSFLSDKIKLFSALNEACATFLE